MRAKRRNSSKSLRQEIALSAARMLAEGSALEFVEAKEKAARSLGLDNFRNLPDNLAVQTELLNYLNLFDGPNHQLRINNMRRAARNAMEALAEFDVRLVGPVLYGSACEYSPINLHIYSDEAEALNRFFLDRGIQFELSESRQKLNKDQWLSAPCYLLEQEGFEFEIVSLPCDQLFHPPMSRIDNKPMRRLDLAGLDKLLEASDEA